MAISAGGIGSGLDINGIISQLVTAEGASRSLRLDNREAKVTAKLSAVGTLKGALTDFNTQVTNVSTLASLASRKVTSGDTSKLTASATNEAAASSYSVEISQLAQAQKLKSGGFSSSDATVGSGEITIQFGTYNSGPNTFTLNPDKVTQTITIDNNSDTLQGIRDAINDADAGVTASIIYDGSNYQLVIGSDDTGLENSLKITIDDDDGTDTNTSGLSQLAFDPTASVGAGENLTQTVAALDSTIIVDGITVNHSSNTISDVIENVTMTLKEAEVGKKVSLKVAVDEAATKNKIKDFVSSFNQLVDTIGSMASYDEESETAGVLLGDYSIISVQSQLRNIMLDTVKNLSTTYRSLSEIGITTDSAGKMNIDDTTLDAALAADPESVSRIFAPSATPPDSNIKFIDSTVDTVAADYSVNVTTLATRGELVGSAAAGLTITAGVNDTLVFSVDGVAATITLAAGTYTNDSLVAEIASRANGANAFVTNDIAISATHSGGVVTLTSNRYGSASILDVTGGNGKTGIMGGAPTKTDGVDVVGTIGGATASGSGQTLTSIIGNAKGLEIKVTGGSTGNRGFVSFSRGLTEDLAKVLDDYIKTDGILDTKTGNFNTTIDGIADDRLSLAKRLESYEARLIKQFSALDSLVASLNSTSNFLTNQLANLPGAKKQTTN